MANLKFADTHNMVVFLAKPVESGGFEQIVDFLNAHTIKYALTINPTIYTSCIEQFWATVKAKTVNGEVQLQALVDGKKIIITESIIRRDHQLEDAEGVDCLPNATIFEQLTLMGLSSKTTAWNEFSSASAIICLATNQKFNFSKYIFKSMVKNLDNVSGKFLMYPRFVQVFVNQQLEGMPTHKRIYIAPSHTKKIFGNMKSVGKGFSGKETPLFQTMMVQDQEEVGKGSEMPNDPHHTPTNHQHLNLKRNKDQEGQRERTLRAATTATGLDAKQDRGNIDMTQSKATLNEPSSSGTSSGSGPRHQETMRDTIAQTRYENVSTLSNDPLLTRVNTLQSGDDRLKLKELMALCITLQSRVLALETTKTTQANEIACLKKRVKKLEQKKRSRTHGLKTLYRGRIADIDDNEAIYLVNVRTDEDMFGVNDLNGDDVIVESVDFVKTVEETRSVIEEVTVVTILVSAAITTTTTTAITDVEMTLAQALAELKSAKPKATTITTTPTLITTTAAITITAVSTRPRAKGLVIHEERAPTPKVSSQQPLQVKAKIDADYQLAKSLQAQEQDEFTNVEKARLFVQFLEQRRKHFAAKRSEEKRNRPPTRAQQRSIMRRAGTKSSKKQKVDDEDKETTEVQRLIEVVPDKEEVAIDAIPLETKPPSIVDWKIHKERKKSYYQIIRADGSLKIYLVFSHMLKSFYREDLETLYKLVKAKYRSTRPVEDLDLVLYVDLKTMFDPHVEDQVWKNQSDYSVLDWKLYDSCGVHSSRKQNVHIHMLVEKRYPLTAPIITDILNRKLQADHWNEMCHQLLKLITKQLKNQ
ncbi:hypothetical protein Tco_0985159 [Tanacetum coccineum]